MISKLVGGIILAICFYMVGTTPEPHAAAESAMDTADLTQKMSTHPSPKPKARTEPLTRSQETVTEVAPVAPKSNERIIWERLIAEGFTREQTAGIMGNVRQEHNFKTDDVPGGLGIAQWTGGRRSALMARGNYLDLNVQLDYLIYELNNTEIRAKQSILSSSNVEEATIAFQNNFERCGTCMQQQRVSYAYDTLSRY